MIDGTRFYDRYKKGETHAIALCTDSNNSYSHFDITMYDLYIAYEKRKIKGDKTMNDVEKLIEDFHNLLMHYNFGSDSPKLYYKTDKQCLIFCTTTYDWYEIKCDYNVHSITMAFTKLLLEHMYFDEESCYLV